MAQPEVKRMKLRVLNLEDNPNDSELIQAELETTWDEVELLRVETRDVLVRALDEFAPDVVLSDFNLPDMSGREALLIVRQSHPDIPVVMVTGALGDIEAVELVKLGARDYVMKDHLQRLTSAVQGALSLEHGIRARKAAEKALHQSEEEVRELVERSPVAMLVDIGTGPDEKVVMMNRHFTELFGYTLNDVPDINHWWQLAYPDEQYRKALQSEWSELAERAIREHGDIEPRETTVSCKNGALRYVRTSFASIGSRNIVTFEDLTRRKALEDALKEAADRNRAITETANDAIICIDPAGNVYLWNRKAEEMFGYAAAEAVGHSLHELIMPQHYREHERGQAGHAMQFFAQTGGGPVVGTTRRLDARRKDGSEFPIELSVSAMNIQGEWHATGIVRDISRRVRDEARIARLNQLYEALSHCNQAIVRSTGEAELFEQICRSVVKFGGFKMAWIGLLDPATRMVVPAASCGEGAETYLRDIKISVDAASEFGHGPTGTAMRDDQPFWCQDILSSACAAAWHERAVASGWHSSAALPLHHEGAVVGAFNLYSDTLNAFEQDVSDLLIEMAEDISYALDNFSHEIQREQAEANLRMMARRAEAMLELPLAAESMSEAEFMQRGQELAEDLTGSRIAFIHFVNGDEESLELVAWSRRTLESYCTAGFDKHYPVSEAGIWADALRRRVPVVFNDYENYPDKHGLPEGHAELRRLISVPVIENGKVVMLTGVGNKETDYTEVDVETVQLISEEIWRIVQQRRSSEALRQSEHNYRMLTEQVPAIIYRASLDKSSSTGFVSAAVGKLGYSPEEWIANPGLWESLIHPDDRENVFALLEQLHRSGGKFSAEYRLRAANAE
jgi:PAS domain S-box-containing protein